MAFGAGGRIPRAAIGATLIAALTVARLLSQSGPAEQPAAPTDEMLSELAGRVAAAVGPVQRVSVSAADIVLQAAVSARLSASGVHVVEASSGVPAVHVTCLENLRDLVCSADVSGATRTVVQVARPRDALPSPSRVRVALELRPLVSLDRRILDVVRSDDEMLVLATDAVLRYEEERARWQLAEVHALPPLRVWPRDTRGRLRVSSPRLELFLPGVTCAGTSRPLSITCAEGSAAWPLDMEDVFLDPLRNVFTTRDGVAFYGVARLSGDPGPGWLLATTEHQLAFFDKTRRAVATPIHGDDVAAVSAACFPAGLVVVSTSEGRDAALTAFEVVGRILVRAAAPVTVTGDVTALWSMGGTALVVTRNPDSRQYVANELSISCSR